MTSLEGQIEALLTCHIKDCGFYDEKTGKHGSDKCFEQQVKNVAALIQQESTKARIDECKELALDHYLGKTFSESTNYQAKFEKFIRDNERRISQLEESLHE